MGLRLPSCWRGRTHAGGVARLSIRDAALLHVAFGGDSRSRHPCEHLPAKWIGRRCCAWLPSGAQAKREQKTRRHQPREGLEQHIAQVWAEHLACTASVAREDNFFDLGGNSLRAIAVVNQLRRTLQCTVNDLYEHPRLADFAGVCRQRPEHLRALIQSAASIGDDYRRRPSRL